jgi:alpha-D-ribose 1-methylphosphonate 5-triphosphate synthase subunit PhnH
MATAWLDGERREQRYAGNMFRLLLGALARPGMRLQLEEPSFLGVAPAPQGVAVNRCALGALYTLLDAEVTFLLAAQGRWLAREHPLSAFISMRTGASVIAPTATQFVCAFDDDVALLLHELNRGTLLEPESSATVLLCVERLCETAFSGARELTLTGPGIRDQRRLFMAGLCDETLAKISGARRDYPLGLDYFLVDIEGGCVGLPRTTRIFTCKGS